MRVISLLPAGTEIVCLLGLEGSLVGVSHVCDYPPSVQDLPQVTRTNLGYAADSGQIDRQVRELSQKQVSLFEIDRAAIRDLAPDLILTQSLCSVCAIPATDVLELAHELPGQPTVVQLNPSTLNKVLECIAQVAAATGTESRAAQVAAELEQRIAAVAAFGRQVSRRPTVVLLEWIDPPFSAGHWNPELVTIAGGDVLLGQPGARSREVEWSEVQAADPDVMIIACCGLSVDRTMDDLPTLVSFPGFARLNCIRDGRVYLVDGSQYFNRPGPRLVDSLELLAHTLHGDLWPLAEHIERAVRMKREPR